MGDSGLQWSFSGNPNNTPQILSFKPSSEGISHSIYPPGFVQNAQKIASAENRQARSYNALVNHSRELLKVNSPSPVRSNSSASPVSSAVVGSTNLRSGESSCNGPSQMTIFYDGLVCVYDDVAPEKAQAIMLLAGNGNSRSQKPADAAAKGPPKAMEVHIVKSISHTDLSGSSTRKVLEKSPVKDPVEVNPRIPASKFQTPRASSPASNHIRLSQSGMTLSAIPVDPVSSGTSTSTVEVNPRIPAMRYSSPTPGSTGTHRFRFSQSAISGASASKVESPKTPASSMFSPPSTVGCNQIRFSQSCFNALKPVSAAIPVDSVSARASTSRGEISSNNPAPSNQIRFSQSAGVSAGASTIAAVEINPKKSASNFPLPSTGSTGSNQIRFSRSAIPIEAGSSGAPISIVESNPIKPTTTKSASNQFRFPQSVNASDPAAGASNSIVESNPIISTTKFPDPATSSGSNKFRFSQSAVAFPLSYLERSMPVSSTSDLKQPNSAASPIDRASPGPSNVIVDSSSAKPASKLQTPEKGSGEANQFRFSQSGIAIPLSYIDRSKPGSSTSDLKKPNSAAAPVDRASPGASSIPVESSAAKPASKLPTPVKGSGESNQLRFTQSGVPLARKISLARFLVKRKERPSGDVADLPPSKFRSNSG